MVYLDYKRFLPKMQYFLLATDTNIYFLAQVNIFVSNLTQVYNMSVILIEYLFRKNVLSFW